MFNANKSVKALAAVALFGAGTLVASLPATAQVNSLSEVLEAVRRDSNELTSENQQRLREFQQATAEQEASMSSLRAELNQAEARGQALQNEFNANEAELDAKQAELESLAGDFGQLLGQFRQAAQESMPVIRNSLASAEYPARAEGLSEVAQSRSLPTREQLDLLPKAILLEMLAQSEVKSFEAEVDQVGPDGQTETKEVFRVGIFNAVTVDGTRFVEMQNGRLIAFAHDDLSLGTEHEMGGLLKLGNSLVPLCL